MHFQKWEAVEFNTKDLIMTKNVPMDDWVVYLLVMGIVAAMLFGKYLMARGNKDEEISSNDKS